MILQFGKKSPDLTTMPLVKDKEIKIWNFGNYIQIKIEDTDTIRKNYLKKLGFIET